MCRGEPGGKPICGQPGGRALGVWKGTGRQTDLWPTREPGSGCVEGNREANRFVANQGAGLWVCGGEPGGKPICGQPGGWALGVWRGTGRQTDLWPTRGPGSGCVEGNREANRFVANQGAGLWVCGGEPGGKPICGQPGGWALGVWRGTGRQTDLWPTRGPGSGCVEGNREANRFVANQGAGLWVCGGEPGGKPIFGQPGGWVLGVSRGTGRQTDLWPTRGPGSLCVEGYREANRFVAYQGGWALGVWRGTGRQTDLWPTRGPGCGCVEG